MPLRAREAQSVTLSADLKAVLDELEKKVGQEGKKNQIWKKKITEELSFILEFPPKQLKQINSARQAR